MDRTYYMFSRLEITEFILQNVNKEFYDFTTFFEKFKINTKETKQLLMNNIITELKNLGWHIASIFGNTAIVIHSDHDNLQKSLWANTFDFTPL